MDKSETIITKTDHALSLTVHYFLAPTRPTYQEAMDDLRCWLVGRSSNPGLSTPLLLCDPEARSFLIPGQNGTKGLNVSINPDGSTLLHPVDPSIPGLALTSISSLALLDLLQRELSKPNFSLAE